MNDFLHTAALAIRGATYDGEKGCFVHTIRSSSFSAEQWARLADAPVLSLSSDSTGNADADAHRIGTEIAEYAAKNGTYPEIIMFPEGLLTLGESYDDARARSLALNVFAEGGTYEVDLVLRTPGVSERASRTDTLRGKVAAVTGGAQGFGEALVRELIAGGCFCYIIDLNYEGAQRLAESLNKEAGQTLALPVAGNVADEESVSALVQSMVSETGGLDLFISNAGVVKAGSVKEMPSKDFTFVTDVNYVGYFHCVKHVSQAFGLQNVPSGVYFTDVIQINSKSGLEGSNRNGAYAGGKFGGIGLTQSFAMELAADNIKVNSICPGNFFDGPLWSDPEKGLFVQYLRAGKVEGAKTVADVQAFYESKVPMGRGCTGRDVMIAVYYIVEQRYETGQAVPVTGGQVMLN